MKMDATRSMRDALNDGRTAEAIDLFDDVDAELRNLSKQESAVRDAAREIIAKVPQNRPVHSAAKQYVESLFAARQSRVEAKNDFLLHLEGGPEGSAVAEKVDTVISARKAAEEREASLRNAGSVPVSEILEIFGPKRIIAPKGSEVSRDYTLLNAGFGTASNVSVTASGYDFDVSPTTVNDLQPNESVTVTVSTTATEEVDTTFTLSAGSVSNQFRVQILSKTDYLERAIELIETLEDRLNSIEKKQSKDRNQSGGEGKGKGKNGDNLKYLKGLRQKLDTVRKRIQKIEAGLSKKGGKSKAAENKIRAVTHLLEAFINQTEGLAPQKIDARTQAILAKDANQVIDELETATIAKL